MCVPAAFKPRLSSAARICSLVIAPFALGYYTLSDIAMYEAVAVGLLIGGIALWSSLSTAAPAYLDYIVALFGGWSIVAPFVLGYH